MKKKMRLQGSKTAFAQLLELPETTLAGGVHIELHANREAIIEGCPGVLEYSPEVVRLSGGGLMVRIGGRGLSIGGLDKSGTVVSGVITSVELQS